MQIKIKIHIQLITVRWTAGARVAVILRRRGGAIWLYEPTKTTRKLIECTNVRMLYNTTKCTKWTRTTRYTRLTRREGRQCTQLYTCRLPNLLRGKLRTAGGQQDSRKNTPASNNMSAAAASSAGSSREVVSARDIAPDTFDRALPQPDDPEKIDDLEYDLHHLVACDTQPRDNELATASHGIRNSALLASARDNVQLLFNRIFQLETKDSDEGLLAVLPEMSRRNDVGSVEGLLPRFRPVPTKKAETRWEKFAREKGIKKRKRDRMVWDERTGKLMPRWGYGRANDDTHDWAIPVGPNDDPYADPFAERKLAKKERVLKNQLKQMANIDRSMGNKVSHGLKANLVGKGNTREKPAVKGKRSAGYHGLGSQTREAVVDAQRSDASMGRFGRLNQGEAKADRGGRRRQRASVAPNDNSERDMTMSVMNRLLGKTHGAVGRVHTGNLSGKNSGGGGGMPGKLKKKGKRKAAARARKRQKK